MRFGEIIKRAWQVTWRFRILWVLGLFAGVTGWTGGGSTGSSGSGWQSGATRGSTGGTAGLPNFDVAPLLAEVQRWLPFAAVGIGVLLILSLAWSVISIGARGGLVWAANEIEEGRTPRLGEAWDVGFSRFWRVLGLGIVLQLPILVVALALGMAVLIPIVAAIAARGHTQWPAIVAPLCGALVIGVPLLIAGSFILGIMYVVGLRFIVLDGLTTMHAAREGWRAFRMRFADHSLMWLINWGLNIAAGLVIAIPMVVVAVAMIVPGVIADATKNWGVLAGSIGVFFFIAVVVGCLYSAIWGTFTSTMWTIFFRRLTGREVPQLQAQSVALNLAYAQAPPSAPMPPAPPSVPTAPEVPTMGPLDMPQAPPAPPTPPMYVPPTTPPAPQAPPPEQPPAPPND